MATYPENESYPTQEQYPTIARSDNFEVWEDNEEDAYIVAFNLNGVTVGIDRELFQEFARVVADAADHDRQRGLGS